MFLKIGGFIANAFRRTMRSPEYEPLHNTNATLKHRSKSGTRSMSRSPTRSPTRSMSRSPTRSMSRSPTRSMSISSSRPNLDYAKDSIFLNRRNMKKR